MASSASPLVLSPALRAPVIRPRRQPDHHQPAAAAAAPAPPLARADEWERHRPRITQLYRDQGLRLDEVISAMARDHGFVAK